jgi:two-component system, OmpR family, response regulator ChvI
MIMLKIDISNVRGIKEQQSSVNSSPHTRYSELESYRRRILIVDDEYDLTLTFKFILRDNGYEVCTYNDPELALLNFKANFYDMILLDFKMPKLNGFQLFRELRKKDNEVKICFFTASEDVDYDEYKNLLSLSVEEKCFIKKPIDMHQLLWLIHRILG